MGKINRSKLFTSILFILSLLILGSTAYYVSDIKVIQDWKLTLPDKPIHAGDTIIVASTYTKLREVTGEATRYVDCWTKDNILISYPINVAIADRASGVKKGTGLILVMPTVIPDLPAKCSIRVNIKYKVLPLRTVHVTNTTAEFTLLPVAITSRDIPPTVVVKPEGEVVTKENTESSAPKTTVAPPPATPSTPSEPNLLDRILQPITNLLGGIQ